MNVWLNDLQMKIMRMFQEGGAGLPANYNEKASIKIKHKFFEPAIQIYY